MFILLNVVLKFIVFLTLSTLICRSTDISKCFSESLGIRDNESRLYIVSIYPCPSPSILPLPCNPDRKSINYHPGSVFIFPISQ